MITVYKLKWVPTFQLVKEPPVVQTSKKKRIFSQAMLRRPEVCTKGETRTQKAVDKRRLILYSLK